MHSSSSNIAAVTTPCARAARRMLPLGAALLLTLLQGCASTPPAPPPAETAHAEAKAAYLANDYRRTLAIVEPLAIRGEPWAQYTLGYMYYYGRGVTMDREMARQWIQRAAQQGYVPAQQALQRLSTEPPKADGEQAEAPAAAAQAPAAPSATAATPSPSGTGSKAPGAAAGAAPAPAAAGNPASTAPPAAAPAPSSPQPAAGPAGPPQSDANAPTQGQTSSPDVGPVPAAPAPAQTVPPPGQGPAAATRSPVHELPAAGEEHAGNGINGAAWIAKQDPQRYTVQLIGAGNEAAVVQFIRNYHLGPQAAYFAQVRNNGKPWYTVIYGSFADRQAARQALARLPAAVDRAKPWIRRFDALQVQLGR